MNTSDLIKSRRLELGLTLEQVAQYVGVGKSTVRKWETGYIKNMRRDKLAKLAEILNISPIDLMDIEYTDENLPATEPPSYFESAQKALEFILSQPAVSHMGGYDLNTMTDEEIIEFAEEIQRMIQLVALKYKK
jgi:repressor LexA